MVGSTLRIAWRSLGRNRKRTALALAAIGLGQLTLVFVTAMMAAVYDDMAATVTGPFVGHAQIHHPSWREERAIEQTIPRIAEVRSAVLSTPGVTRASVRVYGAVLAASGSKEGAADAEPAMVVGVDFASEVGRGGLVEELASVPAGGGAVVGRALARRMGVAAGDQVAVIGQDANGFPVSELFRVSAVVIGTTELVSTMAILVPLEAAQELLAVPDAAHELVVQGSDVDAAPALAASLRELPALAGAQVLAWREAAPELAAAIDMRHTVDYVFVVIVFLAAAAGIANTMMMSTFERTRELGMLLAVGARPARIVRLIFSEAVVLGLAGVALGSVLGAALVLVTGETGVPYHALSDSKAEHMAAWGMNFSMTFYPKLQLEQLLLGVGAVSLTSVLAATWPAALAARLSPAEAMRS